MGKHKPQKDCKIQFKNCRLTFALEFLDYFENKKGLISKIYVYSYSNPHNDHWIFNLEIYDGIFIDKKFAQVQIEIDNVQNYTTLDQTTG